MAGNVQGDNSGNILVEFDYNNIIVVDPNKTIDAFGNIRERLVDHEKMVMFANLEAEVVPRTKLSVGGSPEDKIRTISVAKMNFLRPTEDTFLTSGYYDELTGKNAKNGLGQNQMRSELINQPDGSTPYVKNTVNSPGEKATDNGLLGITSINVTTNTSFVPTVTILLEDIQGRALFQLGNNSPYSAFFNLPYCPFYLTLKGYYGQAIRYQLNLKTFHASFNGNSGNYQIRLEFIGYKFNILNEVSVADLLATPHMYGTKYEISKSPTSPEGSNKSIGSSDSKTNAISKESTISTDNISTQIVSERGYQKIVEVYSEYKAKGLISPDFPELTFAQLMNALLNFEKNIIGSYTKVDVEPLTNIRNYLEILKNYYDTIRGGNDSWFNTFLDPNPIILQGTNEQVFFFKENIRKDPVAQQHAKTLLSSYISSFNELLASNNTLGVKSKTPIKNSITYDTMLKTMSIGEVDLVKTTIEQTGISVPTDVDTAIIKTKLEEIMQPVYEKNTSDTKSNGGIMTQSLFTFESNGKVTGSIPRFDYLISEMETNVNQKLSEYETKITADFTRKVEDSSMGIGFKPTVRNICAVIMASAEAFIRLLDDVHTNAWNVKYDPIRKNAILNNTSSAPGTDTYDNVNISEKALADNQGLSTSQIPVYPWPQFFVETPQDKKGRFQLAYLGDPRYVDQTKGSQYSKWPEVEFVEEYMKGLTQKYNSPSNTPTDSQGTTNIINVNAIEYPSSGIAYVNKEEIKFFYEIWERQFLTSNYSGFIRANSNQLNQLVDLISVAETNNIVTGLGISSPYLTLKLKNYDLTAQNYPLFLENISNQGTGRAYQDFIRDFYVTPYIKNITENSFNILGVNDLGKEPQTSANSLALTQLVKNATNEPLIVDTYPFTDPSWVSNNMSLSNNSSKTSVYNTTNVLGVFQPRNVISNFESVYNYTTNRPVTNFSYLIFKNPTELVTTNNLKVFYDTRKDPEVFVPSEGYVNYVSPTKNLTIETTTSMLNTPYFVNSIQNGVDNWRKKDKYPYTQAAYLFINSLPLASLRERYKTNGASTELDYIASCFKKFGAIHKMPYAWVLKMGSIWYRYKTYKNSGVDILDSAWKNFDYKVNFDPITSSDTKTYVVEFDGIKHNITLQQSNTNTISIQTGFYPKAINDFNVFYNGYDLYQTYSDTEIQNSINNGVNIFNFKDSNITNASQGTSAITLSTWSVVLPNGIVGLMTNSLDCSPSIKTTSAKYYVVPSFGSAINQTTTECIFNNNTVVDLTNNQSMYNGSVRLLWSTPNYGYFDNGQISKPQPDSYVNKILSGSSKQSAFNLLMDDSYSKIEEIFSVFDKSILDKFELEFLNFSKPVADIDLGPQVQVPIGESPSDGNAVFKNFQYLFRSLMGVNAKESTKSNDEYFNQLGNTQLLSFTNTIKSFLEYDVILKYGNPANYKRRIFDSFIASNGGSSSVTDPIIFTTYVTNTLPSKGGTVTLLQSKANSKLQWIALETEVGFSTITNLKYTDNGSYITDFFIDNNIGFTVDNIILCAPLIKMYATQKLYTPTLTSSEFKSRLNTYLQTTNGLQTILLNQILGKVRGELPNQQELPEKTIRSVIDGSQSKVENYEVFKALNDKWIAGGDFKTKTLFEDILFLDRASRNIGDTVIIDIFSLKDILNEKSVNMTMSVFTLMSGILIKNKFNVMPLPAYVNFYNIQDVDGTTIPQPEGHLQFADNMWGTFLDVDYRNSGPKLICFYAGIPSSHLDLPKGNSRFRDDGFELRRASENPLIEDQIGKKDWAVSNKCVGFNVDIGIRNQNIFYSFNVSMDSGRATSEAIQTQLNMVDQSQGKTTTTQNVSLYNLYKQRSYKCEVVCLGNALLQPTMYFNLRHVPMFNGPYMITEVNHTISPGSFQTKFGGIRQGVFDLPSIDNLLQSINQNVLSEIESIIKSKKDNVTDKPITNINKTALLQQAGFNTAAAQNSCTNNIDTAYSTWAAIETTQTSLSPKEFADEIIKKTNNVNLQLLIYVISYIRTFRSGKFYGYNNNFANVELTYFYGESGNKSFIQKQYSCVSVPNTNTGKSSSQPVANFKTIGDFIDFMISRLSTNVDRVFGDNGIKIDKYYACYWPKTNIEETYYDSHFDDYKTLRATANDGYTSALQTNINVLPLVKKQVNTKKDKPTEPNNLNTTTTVPDTCPPPTIKSFSPNIGVNNTILNIVGTGFETTTGITINNVLTTTGITIYTDSNISVIVPKSPTLVIQTNTISVKTKYGNGISSILFTYNPQQSLPGVSALPNSTSAANTNPSTVTLVSSTAPDGTLTVQVAPNVGVWDIWNLPQYVYNITKVVAGPNNTQNIEILKQSTVLTNVPNTSFVSGNVFTMDQNQFLLNVLGLSPAVINSYSGGKVNVTFYVRAIPLDKVKNPQDVLLPFKMEYIIL
jgi:hypothetical protein